MEKRKILTGIVGFLSAMSPFINGCAAPRSQCTTQNLLVIDSPLGIFPHNYIYATIEDNKPLKITARLNDKRLLTINEVYFDREKISLTPESRDKYQEKLETLIEENHPYRMEFILKEGLYL